jgi:ABC-2 type transport system ATP-binding protein
MVKVEGLTKKFGNQVAVDHINFSAKPGEVLGFLGPNGAGKSTTMKMITSYLPQDEGVVTLCGIDTRVDSLECRKHIGYLPEHNPLYIDMYVKEYLHFSAAIHKVNNPSQAISKTIEMTGLGKEQHKLIGSLSKGFKQRVGLAQALLHDPEVLILDEPTSGLDMNQLVDIRALIKDLGKTKTVIFSTHIMQEVQALCDRVVIINEGIIVADDPIEELQNRIKGENLIIVTLLENNFDVGSFSQIESVSKIERSASTLKIYSDASMDIRPDIFRLCASRNWVIIEMSLQKLSVEYIFQKLTKTTTHA